MGYLFFDLLYIVHYRGPKAEFHDIQIVYVTRTTQIIELLIQNKDVHVDMVA